MDIKNMLVQVLINTLKAAVDLVGGFSKTKKMPGWSYGVPTDMCNTGMKLKEIPNSVCADCYADKGSYRRYPAVKVAQYRRLDSISHPQWVEAMIYVMNHSKQILRDKVFRWHDSGDIQGLEHLDKIVRIAIATPDIRYWLPTKESNWIQKYDKPIPKNLVIRLSGTFVDGKEPMSWSHTSTVVTDKNRATCKSYLTDKDSNVHSHKQYDGYTKEQKREFDFGHCGTCRQCWDGTVKNVSYFKH